VVPGAALVKVSHRFRLLPDCVIQHTIHHRRSVNSNRAEAFGFDPLLFNLLLGNRWNCR
jgi:hypothetical protein